MYSRRDFLRDAGLLALGSTLINKSNAQTNKRKLRIATWSTYYNSTLYADFTNQTGIAVEAELFESNEAMLAKLMAGGSGFDVIVATNYTIVTYANLGLIQPLPLHKIPNFDEKSIESRLLEPSKINKKTYAIPKAWGTTGYVINTEKLPPSSSWQEFWDLISGKASGHAAVHDYQATTIGNALKYFDYSFNSTDTAELLKAKELLLRAKPHISAINSDSVKAMNAGAWIAMAWTGDGVVMNNKNPAIQYVIGKEGGEIWCDYYIVTTESKNTEEALALINYLQNPANSVKEATIFGYPPVDKRVLSLLPKNILNNKIMFPSEEVMSTLEFGSAVALSDPLRAEILNALKA